MAVQTIHNPKGNVVNAAVAPGQAIAFDFDLATANFERTGNDLTISLDDGGQVVLDNFFVAADMGSLPPMQLADGTQVDSGDFLAAFDVDVTPAAGAVPSSGINSYDDGAGTLIGGLGLSGSLGNTQWSGATAAGEEYQGITAAGGPGLPPGVPEYRYLAVLYEDALLPGVSTYAFNINLPGAASGDTLNIISSESGYVDTGSLIYFDGKWTLQVSSNGQAAMQADTVYDEIVVEYNGAQYTITVALTTDGSFSPSDAGGGFVSEWYTDCKVAGRVDEIHITGNDGTPGEVWLQGLQAEGGRSNSIQTYENSSAAASAIHVGAGVIASGAGSNTLKTGLEAESGIDIHGNVKVSGGAANTLESGNITVESTSDKGPVMTSGGINSLYAAFDVNLVSDKSGTSSNNDPAYGVSADVAGMGPAAHNIITAGENIFIDVTAGGAGSGAFGLYASGSGAENRLEAGLTVTITTDSAGGDSFAMYAKANGLNVITLTGGADGTTGGEVNLQGGIHAESGGSNEIYGSDGDDVFTLNGAVSGADALIIHGEGGTDTLVLMAADSAEFISNYYDWLEHGDITGIESIDVQLGAGMTSADYEDISGMLSGLGYTDVNYYFDSFTFDTGSDLALLGTDYLSGGLGEQSVNIDGLANNSVHDYSLSELAGSLQGFEHIDLSGGTTNTLTIDSLLDGLNIDTRLDASSISNDTSGLDLTNGMALLITGDAGNDTITLGADWHSTASGTVDYNGQSYDVYTNSSDSSQFLLIQAGLL